MSETDIDSRFTCFLTGSRAPKLFYHATPSLPSQFSFERPLLPIFWKLAYGNVPLQLSLKAVTLETTGAHL
jgi:hypothetical protein